MVSRVNLGTDMVRGAHPVHDAAGKGGRSLGRVVQYVHSIKQCS